MTTNKPEVKRYDCTSGGAQHCYGCYTMKEGELGDYVEWEAYEALQAECDKLRKDAEARRESITLLNYLFARNIIAMQSAVIEWEKGKGAAAGMEWIWNTLFGPGQIPDEDETDAQAFFDREIEPLDAAMQESKP